MSTENDTVKRITKLEENKDIAGLEEIKNEAEATFDGETVGLVEQAISRLTTKVEEVTQKVEITENQKAQVENLGGNESELKIVTAPFDEDISKKDVEIKNLEIETEKKRKEIERDSQEKSTETGQEKTTEIKIENNIEIAELNSKYLSILNKEEPINDRISELGKRDNDLRAERRTLEETGNDKRLEEIKVELEKNEEEGKKLKWGEKVYTLIQQRNEINDKKSLIRKEEYDYWKERSKYDDRAKRLKDLEEEGEKISEILSNINNDENGLDGLKREKDKLIMEFNKKYGYNENFAEESYKKLYSLGRNDAKRVVINNYLSIELPIFSREFKLKEGIKGRVGNECDITQDDSSDGRYNKNLLAQKQLALWEKVKEAREELSSLSEEDTSRLIKENQLVFRALKNTSGTPDQLIENNIADVFMPMAGVGKAMYLSGVEDKNLFPEKGVRVGDKVLTPYAFEEKMYLESNYIMNALILHKLAKENGLIKNKNKELVDSEKEKTPEDQLLEVLGNNTFKNSIDFSRGVELKKYDDEQGKMFFNLYLKEGTIDTVKSFLDSNKIDNYTWISKDRIQINVSDDKPSPFK